jgi:hypothetical protein
LFTSTFSTRTLSYNKMFSNLYGVLWCTLNLLDAFSYESKGENEGRKRSWAWNTLGVERRARALRWGLGRVTSKLITYTNLYKLNNKLVSA